MPNRKPQKKLTEYVVTIDKIEEATGLDFLDKLADDIENKIEAESDPRKWPTATQKIIQKKEVKKPVVKKIEKATKLIYWVTDSTGIRHNSGCRYYKAHKGKESDKDGVKRACKVCGG